MLHFMKYKIGIPILIIAALAAFFSFKYANQDVSGDYERKTIIQNSIMGIINEAHYSPRKIDDSFSNKVYNKVFETTDIEKKIFTKEDFEKLNKYRYEIDDELLAGTFDFYNTYEKIYITRTKQIETFFNEIIKELFDFKADEEIQLNGEKIDYAANDIELKNRWRKYIKYRVLVKYVELQKWQADEIKRRDTLKVKDTSKFEIKNNADLLKTSIEKTQQNLQKFFTKLNKIKPDDRFALYINAITTSEDPHTDYFPPLEKKNFDVQMSGEFYGIGAQLKPEEDKIKVASIVPGSPSWKQGELKPNDEIIKVGQGSAEPEDIQGYELEDVVQKIRGEKGTEVRLTVRRPDGSIKVIPIIRGKVALEETFAKSLIINTSKGKLGYIYLSEFYSNFNSADGRRSAVDVAKEVEKLKNEKVKGIILDLRFNGGGSLNDVVDMTGLFVGPGPVVQVKTRSENPLVLKSKTAQSYDGPLVIMVNQASASASEILAAALQDYNRAVIVGNTTFGKGSVQKQVIIDDFLPPMVRFKMMNEKLPDIGALKLTIQMFYRINGESTQLRGVTPDISIPDTYSDIEIGERKDKSALPYNEIIPVTLVGMQNIQNSKEFKAEIAKMTFWSNSLNLKKLKEQSIKRVNNSNAFDLVKENAKRLKKLQDDNLVFLNEDKFKTQQNKNNELAKKIEELDKVKVKLEIDNLEVDKASLVSDTAKAERNKNWIRLLKKDITLAETVNILEDIGSDAKK